MLTRFTSPIHQMSPSILSHIPGFPWSHTQTWKSLMQHKYISPMTKYYCTARCHCSHRLPVVQPVQLNKACKTTESFTPCWFSLTPWEIRLIELTLQSHPSSPWNSQWFEWWIVWTWPKCDTTIVASYFRAITSSVEEMVLYIINNLPFQILITTWSQWLLCPYSL